MPINALNRQKPLIKRWLFFNKKKIYFRRKIKNIQRILKKYYKKEISLNVSGYKRKWSVLCREVNSIWYRLFSAYSGHENLDYVPEDIYYGLIEPVLNDYSVYLAYSDKNFYDLYYKDLNVLPETVFRNINGIFYDKNYNLITSNDFLEKYFDDEPRVILKPSLDSGGGKNIQMFYRADNGFYYNKKGDKLTVDFLKIHYKKDYLIQKCIEPYSYFKEFNEKALSTIRLYIYRSVKTDEIVIKNAIVRIGGKNSEVDNVNAGGVCCFVYEDGQLSDFAIDKFGNKFSYLPSNPHINLKTIDKIPEFEKMKMLAREIAKRNPHFRLLGLDICLDKDKKVRLIEINNKTIEINTFQFYGNAVFAEYTDEVIEYCAQKLKDRHKYAV